MVNHSQNRVFWQKRSILAKLARMVAPPVQMVAPLCSNFWVGSTGPNQVQDGSLESLVCLLSIPSGISEFGVVLPPQKPFLPRSLSATQKVGRKSFFFMYFELLEAQISKLNFSRVLVIFLLACPFQKFKVCKIPSSPSKCPRAWRGRDTGKNL